MKGDEKPFTMGGADRLSLHRRSSIMSRTYLRGDMYYADLGRGIGSEQEGYRPVVIIQNNKGNKHSPTVIVAAISSKVGIKPKLPTHYFINAECGLERPSIVLLEQIRTLDKQRLTKYIGRLTKEHIQGMNCALAVSVDLIHVSLQSLNVCLCKPCAAGYDYEVTPMKSEPVMKKQMGQGGATNA